MTGTRHLPYERVFNLRDLGGYAAADGRTVRWRALFRGDGIQRLEHEAFAELGIRTVIDLRTPSEVTDRGRVEADGITWFHLPVLQRTWEGLSSDDIAPERFLADRYRVMVDEGAEALGKSLRLLADPDVTPAVFHCAAGKDRTGVLAALVLDLLGVAEDVIAEDYGLSRLGMDRLVEWVRLTYPERFDSMSDQPAALLAAPEGAMRLFLAELREAHGSVEAYAASIGAGRDVVEALRANLLE